MKPGISVHFLLLLLFLAVSPIALLAQQEMEVIYNGAASDLKTLEGYAIPRSIADTLPDRKPFADLINSLHQDGYLLARIDSIMAEGNQVHVNIVVGQQFRWASLDPGNLSEGILNKIGYRERLYREKPFRYAEVNRLTKQVIAYAENNGYPFASIQLDSVSIQGNMIVAALNYQSGPLITFDTVEIDGTTKSKPFFIGNYLRIKPGAPYEEKKVEQALFKLRRLPYLKVAEAPYVTFQLQKGTPHFRLTDVKANQVDGIIGLMPNEGGGGGALITGQFDLLLQNLFGTGKGVSFNWQRTQVNSQNLDIRYNHPNLLRTPLNLKAGFSLLKEDTLFINRNFELAASVLMGKYSSLEAFTDLRTANTISNSASNDAPNPRLSQLADFSLAYYGLGYEFTNLDNLWLPTKGLTFEVEASVGNKKVEGDSRAGTSGDSLDTQLVQYNFQFTMNNYLPVSRRFVIKSRLLAGSVVSDQLYYNDLFRLGGLKSIRGFVENEYFVSDFAIATVEAQYLIDNESFMFLFYDQGYVYADMDQKLEDFPGGLGAGLTFTTNAGTFSFVYALGRTSAQAFNVNFSKIHFGYITRF